MRIRAITACPPAQFDPQVDKYMMELHVDQNMKTFSRIEFLPALHHSVELDLGSLSAVVLKGISSTIKDGRRYLRHLVLLSCISSFPETVDMLGVKKGSPTFFPCYTIFLLEKKCKHAQWKACDL